jgi:hypothetical protein
MVATLSTFGCALLLEHAVHLYADVVILAVALAVTVGRILSGTNWRQWIMAIAVVPVITVGASATRMLMAPHVAIADALFVFALSGGIWIRRFGSRWSQAGTLATLPFIAILITPYFPIYGSERALWSGVVAMIAVSWVILAELFAGWIGFVGGALASARSGSTGKAQDAKPRPRSNRPRASTQMAVQMAVAIAAAFIVGHLVFPTHWIWVVLTTYIVCSGNRGRGDVAHKSAMRIVGATLGTLVATGLSGVFPPGDAVSIVAIFVVLGVALWLRPINYAYWAACVTAALALLYDYYGNGGVGLLGTRLEGILLGAIIGTAATWLILPVKTADVLRRREADVLAALSACVEAIQDDPSRLKNSEVHFDQALGQMDHVARTLRVGDIVLGRWHVNREDVAAEVLHRCAMPMRTLTESAVADSEVLSVPAVVHLTAIVSSDVASFRRAFADRSLGGQDLSLLPNQQMPIVESLGDRAGQAVSALTELHAVLHAFAAATMAFSDVTEMQSDPTP